MNYAERIIQKYHIYFQNSILMINDISMSTVSFANTGDKNDCTASGNTWLMLHLNPIFALETSTRQQINHYTKMVMKTDEDGTMKG